MSTLKADAWDIIGALAAALLFFGLCGAWSWPYASLLFGGLLLVAYIIREIRLARGRA